MITITFDIEKLFNLVIQRTVYFSTQLDQATVKADLIPMTEDDREWFYTCLREACTKVWEKLGTFAAASEDFPYILDIEGDESSTSSAENKIIFKLDEPASYRPGVQNALVTNAIQNAIVFFIVCEWLRLKGFTERDNNWQIEYTKHTLALPEIRRHMEYYEKPKLKYRTY